MRATKHAQTAVSLLALVVSAAALTLVVSGCCRDGDARPATPANASRELFGQSVTSGYSGAARYGDLVWTAGHQAVVAKRGSDIALQTEEVLTSLERTLKQAGADFSTVVMTNVSLTDFNDWEVFNATYRRHFTRGLPPRVTVQVGQLGRGDIEISMVAHVKP